MVLASAELLAVGASWRMWRSKTWMGAGAASSFAAAAARNAALLSPYLVPSVAPWPQPKVAAGACGPGDRLRVLSVNVQRSNMHDIRLLDMVREADPDVAWFQEVDAWWEQELSPLGAPMPHGVAEVQANYFGVHLHSRMPLIGPKVRHLTGSRNLSVFTALAMPSGATARLYAVHPRPPQVGQGTVERDAQMMAAALAARGQRGAARADGRPELSAVGGSDPTCKAHRPLPGPPRRAGVARYMECSRRGGAVAAGPYPAGTGLQFGGVSS